MSPQTDHSPLTQVRVERSPEVIYQQHYARIYGIQGGAEDVCQQLFLKLYQLSPDQIPADETKFVGWLYRVTLNAGYNILRSQKRRTTWHDMFDRLWPFSRTAPRSSPPD